MSYWEKLRLLHEAEKACEFQVNDCLFWINEYRRSGRKKSRTIL